MFMDQISLKKLVFESLYPAFPNPPDLFKFSNLPFTTYPKATECLRDLSELTCRSNIYPEFFCQMSQICHNLQSLCVTLEEIVSDGLADLISNQQNLKYLSISNYSNGDLAKI